MLGHPDRLWGGETRHHGIAANLTEFGMNVIHAGRLRG